MVGRKILLAASLLLLALAPVGALAADIKTQSSTQYLWYNDPFQDKTQGDILQDVKPSATKIDATGRFSTVGYSRVRSSSDRAARRVVKASPFDDPYFTDITTQAQLRAADNYKFVFNDPRAHVHNWWYAAQLLYDSLNDLETRSCFPAARPISPDNRNWKGGVRSK